MSFYVELDLVVPDSLEDIDEVWRINTAFSDYANYLKIAEWLINDEKFDELVRRASYGSYLFMPNELAYIKKMAKMRGARWGMLRSLYEAFYPIYGYYGRRGYSIIADRKSVTSFTRYAFPWFGDGVRVWGAGVIVAGYMSLDERARDQCEKYAEMIGGRCEGDPIEAVPLDLATEFRTVFISVGGAAATSFIYACYRDRCIDLEPVVEKMLRNIIDSYIQPRYTCNIDLIGSKPPRLIAYCYVS